MIEKKCYDVEELKSIIRKALKLSESDTIWFTMIYMPPENYQETGHDKLTGFMVLTEKGKSNT